MMSLEARQLEERGYCLRRERPIVSSADCEYDDVENKDDIQTVPFSNANGKYLLVYLLNRISSLEAQRRW